MGKGESLPAPKKKPQHLCLPPGHEFVIDTREQLPYELAPARVATLETGDYSVTGFENEVVVERKSLSDLLGVVTSSRERFERELERLSRCWYAALVIEAGLPAVAGGGFDHTRVNGSSVLGSIIAWSIRFRVHPWFVGSRRHGQMVTERILVRAARDRFEGVATMGWIDRGEGGSPEPVPAAGIGS